MKTLKDRIEEASKNYWDESVEYFKYGADFAIKAVIEMLEEQRNELVDKWHVISAGAVGNIIEKLKSEA